MTEHEDLIARLRAVVDVALMDASAASSEFDCSESDYRATEAHCRELEAVRDELIAALEKVTAERDGLIQTITERVREAEARIERVRNARAEHPVCEMYEGDDVVSCGWKRVVLDIDKALEEVEDGE